MTVALRMQQAASRPAAIPDTGPYDIARQEEYATITAASISVVLRQTPVDGNLLVCRLGGLTVSAANLIGPGAGWTLAVSRQASGAGPSVGIWWKIAASDSATITCTAGASTPLVCAVREYPGVTATPADVTASNSSATGVTTLGLGTTGATAQADELAVSVLFTNSTTPLRLTGWTDSFDEVLDPKLGGPLMHCADRVLSATGTVTATPTWTTSNAATGAIATFKLSAPPANSGWRVRRLASGTFTTVEDSGLTRASRSFHPSANRLVFAVFGTATANTPVDADTTLSTSHGGTLAWDLVSSYHGDGGASTNFPGRRVYIYRAVSPTDPGSGTVTFNFNQTGLALWYTFIEVAGADLSGLNGASAIVQVAGGVVGAAIPGTSIDITQAAPPAAGSMMLGICLHGVVERHVHEAGYRIIQEGQAADNGQQVSAFWLPSGDQTCHVSWASTIHCVATVAEIKSA